MPLETACQGTFQLNIHIQVPESVLHESLVELFAVLCDHGELFVAPVGLLDRPEALLSTPERSEKNTLDLYVCTM